MELPDDATKFPKLPFIIGDCVFLAVAGFLAYTADSPPSTATIIGVIVCTGIGVALGVAPFLKDYVRSRDQQLTERQNALEALVRTTSAAADQASIAANGLHEIAEITKRNLHKIEELPAQIQKAKTAAQSKSTEAQTTEVAALQSALNEFASAQAKANATQAATLATLRAEVAKLKGEKSSKPVDLTPHFEKILTALESLKIEIPAAIKIPDFPVMAASSSAPAAIQAEPPVAAPIPKKKAAPKPRPTKEKPVDSAPSLFDDVVVAETTATTAQFIEIADEAGLEFSDDDAETESSYESESDPDSTDDPVAANAALTKTDDEKPSAAENDESPVKSTEADVQTEADDVGRDAQTEGEEHEEPDADADAADDDAALETDAPAIIDEEPEAEPALSSDGLTRLTVTAYIGIGNRLFVRGDGPGLSLDEGTPLQFVSIGKWRWETDAATSPFKVTLWKNDQEQCTSVGEIKIKPGALVESSANF
jgi:hypothetical protein